MKIKNTWLALALCLVTTPVLMAENTVSWAPGQPMAAAGKVRGSGTYKAEAGWKATSVTLKALPAQGGMSHIVEGKKPDNNQWNTITITDLPAGQYAIFVIITFKKAGAKPEEVAGPTVFLSVP